MFVCCVPGPELAAVSADVRDTGPPVEELTFLEEVWGAKKGGV